MFENLKKLSLLELSHNSIETVSLFAFYDLENLKFISLATNKLHTIPQNLFINNKLIERIFLNGNPNLVELPNRLFSNLTKLNTVTLSECGLKYLPEDLFLESINLQDISLDTNQIEYLPNKIFRNLENLENIDLGYNKIKELPKDLFSTTTKLKSVNLENNHLISIKKTYFEHLQILEILDLKNNQINEIDVEAFRRNRDLEEIILANNQFDLPKTVTLFDNNLKLKRINLSNNNITSITDDFRLTLLSLEELDLSYNQMTYLEFSNIFTTARPISIDLSYNNIETVDFNDAELMIRIEDSLGRITTDGKSRIVKLDGNPVACDCRLLGFIQYLEQVLSPATQEAVSIQFNNLTCVSPSDLYGRPVAKLKSSELVCSLEQMAIEGELTEKCVYGFRPKDESLIVNCTNANFTSMPILVLPERVFFKNMEVHLQKNQITTGPEKNMGYENVTKLFLSQNKIKEISWIPPKIELLELNNNSISRINNKVLSMLNRTFDVNITLGNNPWKCDCSTMNLIDFILTSYLYNRHIDTYQITCADGKPLVNFNVDETCQNQKVALLFLLGYFLMILVMLWLGIVYYGYQLEIKVWLFMHNWCSWYVWEEEVDKNKRYDAFVSYSYKDENFVKQELLPILEQGPQPYKLCVHIRDWIVGELISRQIIQSVHNSRRTLIVLSRNFLESEWGKMEFRTAHKQALQEGRTRIIVILYGDIDLWTDLDDEFKMYVKANIYIEWGDPWFWDKLRYALPHSRFHRNE
ncbi:hypothetical protein ILUMI_21339 [Ignelater luminosus]|uniref:TIR domain-containing protein n=1 Tax=Ignelater luminosus TaxID=2038154 RepID=A0A8K0G1I9_IGNLU|nr:hypothetical protein ILUMI_21339 [Ignelater luminosus]